MKIGGIMNKNIILIISLIVIISFFIGLYLYKFETIKEREKIAIQNVEEEKTEEKIFIKTENQENKISVNTKITEKLYYKSCNHILKTTKKVDEKYINLTEEEFKVLYPKWQIHKFTQDEVIIYREIDDFCGEHYKIKEDDGYISIYKLDKYGNENILIEKTEIVVEYLPEEDIKKIKKGIIVYSKKELNKMIEDYE